MQDNTPFSPLDPLGSSYGKINPPSIDALGLSPFEGERLSMKPINFPKPNIIPGSNSLQRGNLDVKTNVAGSPPGPTGSKNPNSFKGKDVQQIAEIFKDYAKAITQSNQDKNEYAKIYAYDAGPDSGSFYKRYAAYGQDKFDAIGFHPFRDNESIFNAKTTGWNDFSRMMTHAAGPLFTRGFVAGPKSLWKALHGDFSGDQEDAKIYAEAAAIGSSSKRGIGAFFNNAAMNFSYSAGIMAEAVVEESIGLLLAIPTGGASAIATTANVGRNVLRAGKALNTAMDLSRAAKTTLKSMDNINTARQFWTATKTGKTFSAAGRFANPLENTFDAVRGVMKNDKNLTGLARSYDGVYKTAGGFYRDVRGLNMALSEARLEAGMQQNDVYKELYNEHYIINGEAPSNETQQMLLQTAKEASMITLGWNSALIYFSNKLVIPNIVGPRGGIANMLKSKTQDIIDLKDGFIRKSMKDTVLKSGKKVLTPEYSYVRNTAKNTLTSFYKDPLRKSIKGGLTYFKANITEGFQENAQNVIAEATKNYYLDKYRDPAKVNAISNFEYARRLTTHAIKDQFTAEGLETFASGFVMGMFSAPLDAIPKVASIGYNKMFDREAYQEYKNHRQSYGDNLAKSINSISIPEFFDSRMMNYGTQLEANELAINGTEKESKDAATAALIDQLKPMLAYGTTDHFKEYIQSFKGLTSEEFEEVLNVEKGTGEKYLARIDEVVSKVDRIKKRHDYWTEKFPNPVSYDDLKNIEGTADHDKAAYLHYAWNAGIDNAVYFNEAFEDTSKRMSSIIDNVVVNSPIAKASATDVKVLFDSDLLDNELGILDSEVKNLKESTSPDASKNLAKKEKKLNAMKSLKVLTEGYKDFIANRKNIEEEFKKEGVDEETISEQIYNVNDKFLTELQKGFNSYLKTLGELSQDYVFDESLEEAFVKYVDFHLLSNERDTLVQSINLFNDPQGFIEHVQRNQDWMKEIYENKATYYEDMKNKAFDMLEGNALLNQLANKGIYISLDDYESWKSDKVLPNEFYDDVNKVVIRPGNAKYEELAMFFQMLDFSDQTGAYDPIVKQKIEDLQKQLEAEIDKLPKQEIRKDLGEITKGSGRFIKVEKINKELLDGEYADAKFTLSTGDTSEAIEETITFYKDNDILKLNNKEGEAVDLKNFKSLSNSKGLFASVQKYTQRLAPDPVEVERLTTEFNNKKEEIIREYIENGQQAEGIVEIKPISTESSIEEISNASVSLYNDLMVAFEEYADKIGITETLSPDDFEDAFQSFIKTNPIAADIISDYKKNLELEAGTEADPTDKIPVLSLGDRQVKLSELSDLQLRDYLRTFESGLKLLEAKENPTQQEIDKINNYKYSIKVIEDYLGKVKTELYTPKQKETLDKIQKVIDAQDDLLKTKGGYVINGKVLARVTNVIKQFETEEYRYAAEDAVLAAYRTTIETDGLNSDSIDAFVQQLRMQSLPGFSEFTYNELTNELEALTRKDLAESNINLEDFILGVVLEKTYESSRVAGNYTDDQLRNVFDNRPAVFNEDQITSQAYDALFSMDPTNPGYITQIKNMMDEQGMVVISRVSPANADERGLVVFDEEAGVAGEIDLLVIDNLGNLLILDVKTGKSTKWKGFEKQGNIASKKDNYTLQQATYASLLYNLTGLQADIAILPIEIDYDAETGQINKAKGRPSAVGLLPQNDFKIPLEITPEIQEKINTVIQRKVFEVDVVSEQPVSSEDGMISPYEDYIDDGAPGAPEYYGVDPQILSAIANSTQEQLDNVKKVLADKIGLYDVTEITEIQKAVDERQRQLDSNSKAIKYTPQNIGNSSTFISENAIFMDATNEILFADTGDTVVVRKVNSQDNILTLQNMKGKEKEISFDELNKLFKLKEQVMDFEDIVGEEAPLSKVEKDFMSESAENVRSLLKDVDKKEALKTEATKQTLEEVDDDLFNDTTSDC